MIETAEKMLHLLGSGLTAVLFMTHSGEHTQTHNTAQPRDRHRAHRVPSTDDLIVAERDLRVRVRWHHGRVARTLCHDVHDSVL